MDCSQSSLVDWDTDGFGKSISVVWVNLVEQGEHVFLDIFSCDGGEWTGQVLDQVVSVSVSENVGPESSWLLEVSVWMLVFVSTDLSLNLELVPGVFWILLWTVHSVWLVVWLTSVVAIDGCSTISNVAGNSSSVRAVDWDLLVVLSKSVSVGIWIGEKSSLKHLIHGWLNTWHQVAWGESGLLNLSVIVLWVSIQSHLTNLMEWVVLVGPDLGDIEDVESVGVSILFWHELNVPGP